MVKASNDKRLFFPSIVVYNDESNKKINKLINILFYFLKKKEGKPNITILPPNDLYLK